MRQTLFGLPLLVSCAFAQPIATRATNNPEIKAETLFEVDGCTIYRFWDGPAPRYFTRCAAAAPSSAGWDESCGKNCVRFVEVNTSQVPSTPEAHPN
jgi:hypothetical protein